MKKFCTDCDADTYRDADGDCLECQTDDMDHRVVIEDAAAKRIAAFLRAGKFTWSADAAANAIERGDWRKP